MKPYYTLADLLDEGHPFDAGESVPAKLAVIGFPIAHSKSPAMQQAALDAAGIRARYIRIQASPEEFGEVVRLLRERGFTGANVTVPHKQAACSLCNDTDALSRVTGSVNTLVFQKDGSVSGFNTDGPGFARAIREEFSVDLRDLKVALLGSCGGAGLALAYTCAMQRCERLTLAGRSEEKLQELKNRLSSFFIDEHRLEGASDRLAAHQNNTPRFNAAVEDAESVLLAAVAVHQQLRYTDQFAFQIINAGGMQLHATQRHQHARFHHTATRARQQSAMHRHRLCAVFAQMDRLEHAIGTQGVIRCAMIVGRDARMIRIMINHALPQAHRALVRNQQLNVHAQLRAARRVAP